MRKLRISTTLTTTLSAMLCGLAVLLPAAHAQDPAIATVTVAGKKEAVVQKIDKTVYDVANMAKAANGTAQDVLQSTPELSVTADGQISVKGNSNVTVLVNGKPTAMSSTAASALTGPMPARSVRRDTTILSRGASI